MGVSRAALRPAAALLLAAGPLAGAGLGAAAPAPPAARKAPVTDVYHGVEVRDDYRWLEDWSDPKVRAWSEEQNAYARSILDALAGRARIARRVRELESSSSVDDFGLVERGGTVFALKRQPPRQHPFLVVLDASLRRGRERVVVDPGVLDPRGSTSIDWFVPSLDGRRIAVSLSEGGSESGTVRVFDARDGAALPDVIPRVNGGTAGGSLAWSEGSAGFFYTRYPREGERPAQDLDFYQQVWFHKLGSPIAQDAYALGKDFPRIAETELTGSADGRYVLATVKNGDAADAAHFLRGPGGAWRQVAAETDDVAEGKFGPDGTLYLLSRRSAPRGKILRLAPDAPSLASASELVGQSEAAVLDFWPTRDALAVLEIVGGPHRLRRYDLRGRPHGDVAILPVSSVNAVVPLADGRILFRNQSDVAAPAWYRSGPDGAAVRLALTDPPTADFHDTEVTRAMATSRDGTKVPLTILRRKGTRLDGDRPTVLYGYGGFRLSESPSFSAGRRLWIERGGVWAVANLRGGSEFGEDWHRAGNLTRKQNVFDDFLACAQFLIDARYTRPARLAIEGGSNGGLLMGAALTQRPELFRAVVSHVGIYDMLRVELSANGTFNIPEFGSVKDPAQFQALYAYSPYHRVRDGTKYPAVLLLTGANDPRVDPMQSRKMTARLQAATASGEPILLRTSSGSGHGFGTALDEAVAQDTDVWAFLVWKLGVPEGDRVGAGRR